MSPLLAVGHPLENSKSELGLSTTFLPALAGSRDETAMLDTIKVAIPLTQGQHRRIHKIAAQNDTWTWALFNQGTGESLARKFKGLAQTDGESYHREIRFDYAPRWSHDAKLWVEFSVPKFWYGHNVVMLYDWPQALRHFRKLLIEQFELKRLRFPEIETWEVYRADACYAYGLPTQQTAQLYLDSLKRQRFPRKQPAIHPHSIFFGGGTFAFKVYLKKPEFMAHDRKELVKQKASYDWIEHLERLAEGVLRVEASMRRKYLTRIGIKTVGDMMGERSWFEWDSHYDQVAGFDPKPSMMAVLSVALADLGVTEINEATLKNGHPLIHGRYYHAPDTKLDAGVICYYHPAGGFTYNCLPILFDRLKTLLHRFLGGVQGMQTVDKVEIALSAHYKSVKVARLIGFWLYVKQFGADKARATFGQDSYYYNRRQLKAAGVGLVEANENIIKADPEFFRDFGLEIPSKYAHLKQDEYRNSGNVLNLDSYRAG